MGPFQSLSSQVMTAPEFISAPVPEAVTTAPTAPMGSPAAGKAPRSYSIFQMSSSSTACAQITLQQSITLPPPTARTKSTPRSRASAAPALSLIHI